MGGWGQFTHKVQHAAEKMHAEAAAGAAALRGEESLMEVSQPPETRNGPASDARDTPPCLETGQHTKCLDGATHAVFRRGSTRCVWTGQHTLCLDGATHAVFRRRNARRV